MRAVLMVLIACSHEPQTTQKTPAPPTPPTPAPDAAIMIEDAMSTPTLKVDLDVTPAQITLATRDQVHVRVTVTNLTKAVIDPQIGMSTLTVNGTASKGWSLSLNNSGHPGTWHALPASQKVSQAVAGIGEELFPAAGDYTVELVVSGVAAAPVKVHVTP